MTFQKTHVPLLDSGEREGESSGKDPKLRIAGRHPYPDAPAMLTKAEAEKSEDYGMQEPTPVESAR